MKKFAFYLMVLASLFALSACGEQAPRIDTSSSEAVQQSMQLMMAELSPEQQVKLQQAITGFYVLRGLQSSAAGLTSGQAIDKANQELHGKTAKEILAYVKQVADSLDAKRSKN